MSAREAYQTCISNVLRSELKQRLASYEEAVVGATAHYEQAAQNSELHTLDKQYFGPTDVADRKEMAKVYTMRMADPRGPGHYLYSQIRLSASWCPLCGHRDVATLDHHLPKAHFAFLSVSPSNLIPACSDCNKTKTDKLPTERDRETLHPYFDNIDSDTWLAARIFESEYPRVHFYVNPPDHWPETLTARVQHHFSVFKLNLLYASQAVNELSGTRYTVHNLFEVAGTQGVREYMEARFHGWDKVRRNYWATALFKALTDSEWYCSGGFNNV